MMAAVTSSVFMGPPFCGSPFSLAHLAHRAQSPAATSNHPNPYSDHQAGLPMAVPRREPPADRYRGHPEHPGSTGPSTENAPAIRTAGAFSMPGGRQSSPRCGPGARLGGMRLGLAAEPSEQVTAGAEPADRSSPGRPAAPPSGTHRGEPRGVIHEGDPSWGAADRPPLQRGSTWENPPEARGGVIQGDPGGSRSAMEVRGR